MPDSLQNSIETAWNLLWNPATPYHLPATIRNGVKHGLTIVQPIESLSFPDTGDVVLFNREPWGAVSINLKQNEVSQLYTITNEGLEFDPQTGIIQAKIRFTELKYAGNYAVQRGLPTGSALRVAGSMLKAIQPSAAEPGDDANVTMAKSYKSELIQTENGRYMVGTYYDHNEAYCQAFTNTRFVGRWQNWQTNGKTTKDYAAQTYNAGLPENRNSVSVNGTPDNEGNSDYNSHAFFMQTLVVGTCNAQKNTAAATAASTFQGYAQGPSAQSHTVNSAIATANSQPHPPTKVSSPLAAQIVTPQPPKPQWMKDLEAQAAPIIAEIEKEEEDKRRGITLREQTGLPIHSGFRDYIATPTLTVTGTARQNDKGEMTIELSRLSGSSPDVNLTLGAFPGELFPEVQATLAKLNFLKAVLGKRIVSTLGSPQFLNYLSRQMSLAVTGQLGAEVR